MRSEDELGGYNSGHPDGNFNLPGGAGKLQAFDDGDAAIEEIDNDIESDGDFESTGETDDSDYEPGPSRKKPKNDKATKSGRGAIPPKPSKNQKGKGKGHLGVRHGSGITKKSPQPENRQLERAEKRRLERPEHRNIIRWREPEMMTRLHYYLVYLCDVQKIKLPWEEAIRLAIGPHTTEGATRQHYQKMIPSLIREGTLPADFPQTKRPRRAKSGNKQVAEPQAQTQRSRTASTSTLSSAGTLPALTSFLPPTPSSLPLAPGSLPPTTSFLPITTGFLPPSAGTSYRALNDPAGYFAGASRTSAPTSNATNHRTNHNAGILPPSSGISFGNMDDAYGYSRRAPGTAINQFDSSTLPASNGISRGNIMNPYGHSTQNTQSTPSSSSTRILPASMGVSQGTVATASGFSDYLPMAATQPPLRFAYFGSMDPHRLPTSIDDPMYASFSDLDSQSYLGSLQHRIDAYSRPGSGIPSALPQLASTPLGGHNDTSSSNDTLLNNNDAVLDNSNVPSFGDSVFDTTFFGNRGNSNTQETYYGLPVEPEDSNTQETYYELPVEPEYSNAPLAGVNTTMGMDGGNLQGGTGPSGLLGDEDYHGGFGGLGIFQSDFSSDVPQGPTRGDIDDKTREWNLMPQE